MSNTVETLETTAEASAVHPAARSFLDLGPAGLGAARLRTEAVAWLRSPHAGRLSWQGRVAPFLSTETNDGPL
jgi:ABC-type iron transport system FetAB ATPase subunit